MIVSYRTASTLAMTVTKMNIVYNGTARCDKLVGMDTQSSTNIYCLSKPAISIVLTISKGTKRIVHYIM